ncbi:hypothetical protein GVY41_11440 [Frigidibacter albus]|uniref:Uncharacterized protein n=1 Tax=Frigidibacter albus TaxID=1465486 RepID=A0A6L8VHC6_9RHOB|nr:hypothetical protein [Frigidibacter albus]MZQ89705.1 hypothetical protein [Frigidibacter albus]NBE31611.1 hypothetical protein [Frigidibacter albus]
MTFPFCRPVWKGKAAAGGAGSAALTFSKTREPAAGGAVVMAGKLRRNAMPILLWLLGVPGVVIIILLLMGVF